jgi:signal transduction histidine kinase
VPTNFSVLIVEDDDDIRRNMEDILSLDGYRVTSASHCLPAITAIESQVFDVAIVDWRLPDGDGDDLISMILQYQPDVPVVVITGMREFDTAVQALRRGAYDFLVKPINPELLRSVLGRLVERKKHLVEIEASRNKLLASERLAAVGQMVAGLAHEARNAFQRSHACLAELSLDLAEMPESLKLVRKVQKALDDVHHLLEEVRQYSAPIILERRPCCLTSLLGETWQKLLDAKSSNSQPRLTIHPSDNFPQSCYVDPDRLGQVFRNLLENAAFACRDPGEIQVGIFCETKSNPFIRIEISDNGEGVDEKNRELIFAPFFTTKTKGTGLGLAISNRIVEAHEGRIRVEDSDLGGAKFIVEIPLRSR